VFFSASLLHYASSIEYQKKYERATIISEDNMLNSVIWNIAKKYSKNLIYFNYANNNL